MKKCASCTKDLPEAALHCVFCGAKQPPAPAVQPGLAKTAFGYSNEMMEQLKSAAPPSGNAPGPYAPPAPPAYAPPQPPAPPRHPPSQPPPHVAAANAATMFVTGGPPQAPQQPHPPQAGYPPPQQPMNPAFMQTAVSAPPQPSYGQPQYPQQPQPMGSQQPGMGIQRPNNYTPQPIPPVSPPYLASQTAGRAGRPIEPWKDALPLLMIVWGIATLVAFATPLTTSPSFQFNWDIIIHGEGKAKIGMLVIAAIGLLGVVLGAIPMVPMPRGILATLLGLSGVLVPMLVSGNVPPWQILAPLVGILLLLPGLLLRNEYTESTFARLLVTFGVIAVLLPTLVPDHGQIPLVALFKQVIDGHIKGEVIVFIAMVVLAVLCLLVWLPAPATAAGKMFAWIWMLAPAIITALGMVDLGSHAVDMIKGSPFSIVAWVPMTTCAVFVGYGLATVLGKQLE